MIRRTLTVSLDFVLFTPQAVADELVRAGFGAVEVIEREPYPDVEYPSRRAYVFARKPDRADDESGRTLN